jgi:hypothetical protein
MSLSVITYKPDNELPVLKSKSYFMSVHLFRLYSELPLYDPFLITVYDGSEVVGVVLATVIRHYRWMPRRYTGRCMVIGYPEVAERADSKEIAAQLLDRLNEESRRISLYTEIRNVVGDGLFSPLLGERNYNASDWFNIVNPLPGDVDTAFNQVSPSKRRQIKIAENRGVMIKAASNMDEINAFYVILQDLYSHIAKPLPPRLFFQRFFKDTQNTGRGVILIAYHEKQVIGGVMCPGDDTTLYEWYIAGMDRTQRELYPSAVLTWSAIAYAVRNGYRYFDFMGGGKADKAYGVRDFKLRFGGELQQAIRYRKKHNTFWYALIKANPLGIRHLLIKKANTRKNY